MEKGGKDNKNLGILSIIMMVLVALVFDLVSGILTLIGIVTMGILELPAYFLQIILNFIAAGIFAFWFWYLGFGLVSPKRLIAPAFGLLVEFMPLIRILPGFTIAVVGSIIVIKLEKATGLKLPSPGNKK